MKMMGDVLHEDGARDDARRRQATDMRQALNIIDSIAARLKSKVAALPATAQSNAVVLFVLLSDEGKHCWGFEPGADRARPLALSAYREHDWVMFRAPACEMAALLGGTLDPEAAQSAGVRIVGNDESLYHWVTTAWASPQSILSLRTMAGA